MEIEGEVKITRKQAILALLGIAAASAQNDLPSSLAHEASAGSLMTLPRTYEMMLDLADKTDKPNTAFRWDGCHGLTIHYSGETRIITAKEIWEALA